MIEYNKKIKNYFKIFNNYPLLNYFDHAATTFMPDCVMDTFIKYHESVSVSSNRTGGKLGKLANKYLSDARTQITKHFSAQSYGLVFTKNATEALNVIANGFSPFIKKGDLIILTELEHHSALLPWIKIASENGAIIVKIPLNADGNLDYTILENFHDLPVKIIAATYISNVTGTIVDFAKLKKFAKKNKALFVLDISQTVGHQNLNLNKLDADAYAMSAHKMYGPKNIGGLFIRSSLIPNMNPLILGGGMVRNIFGKTPTWEDGVEKFEAGTFDIGLIMAWEQACKFLKKISFERIKSRNYKMYDLISKKIISSQNLIPVPSGYKTSKTLIAFTHKNLHVHDLEQLMHDQKVIVRSGHMCSQITLNSLGISGVIRISWGLCNDYDNVDYLLKVLENIDKLQGNI